MLYSGIPTGRLSTEVLEPSLKDGVVEQIAKDCLHDTPELHTLPDKMQEYCLQAIKKAAALGLTQSFDLAVDNLNETTLAERIDGIVEVVLSEQGIVSSDTTYTLEQLRNVAAASVSIALRPVPSFEDVET